MEKVVAVEEAKKQVEGKVCRKCGFRSSEKTLWICPNCHSDTFEKEGALSMEDWANLEKGKSAF